MDIRKAAKTDLDGVARIYDALHDAEEAGTITVGWIRGVYPTRATAEAALLRMCAAAEDNGVSELTLDEINAEIERLRKIESNEE